MRCQDWSGPWGWPGTDRSVQGLNYHEGTSLAPVGRGTSAGALLVWARPQGLEKGVGDWTLGTF